MEELRKLKKNYEEIFKQFQGNFGKLKKKKNKKQEKTE